MLGGDEGATLVAARRTTTLGSLQNEIFYCDSCLSPILSFSTPGTLLGSINLQNRGGLTYPNYQFVSFFKELADIATTEILSYLAQENICKQLVTIFFFTTSLRRRHY
jgi:hypothetical protein